MSAMESQITTLAIVYSTVYSWRRSKKTSKLRVTGLAGNSPVTSELPAQRASNAENVSLRWRHHDAIGPITIRPIEETPGGIIFSISTIESVWWQDARIFYHDNALKNIVCKIAAILFKPKCVNQSASRQELKTLIIAWISDYGYYKGWGEIIYPFPNFSGCAVEVWDWISNLSYSLPSMWSLIHAGIKVNPY